MSPESLRYTASIDLAEKNSSHTQAFDMLQQHAGGRSLRVLEVGCASGYWGTLLRNQGHHVVGIEPDMDAASHAREVLDEVFCGYLDAYLTNHPDVRFDVISFVDVLEHTSDPVAILKACHEHLNPDGLIIASIPNVTHLAVRAMLLAGAWDYARTGIMDDSHLRFFSRRSVLALFSAAGFVVDQIETTTMTCAAMACQYGLRTSSWFRGLAWLAASDCTWRDFQYVVSARSFSGVEDVREINARHADLGSLTTAWVFKLRCAAWAALLQVKLRVKRVLK